MVTATHTQATAVRLTDRPHGSAQMIAAWRQWIERRSLVRTSTGCGRVLLISYQFPPTGGSGVQRPAKLAKYLPACGWNVEVLTADHDRFPWVDATLLDDLPANVDVHRIAGREPACLARRMASIVSSITGTDSREATRGDIDRHGRWSMRRIEDGLFWRLTQWAGRLGLGNGESLWIGPAAYAAVQRHREEPFDAVISTGPPHFVHRVAMRVVEATGLPWLADLRDPLVSDFDRQRPSRRHLAHTRALERTILERASTIITTCPSFAIDLQERYPHRMRDIRSIANGFDRDDIISALEPATKTAAPCDEQCEFVAVGSFYGRRELARMIAPLQRILQSNPSWHGRVRLTVAGTIDAEQRRYWQDHKPEWLTLAGYLSHAESIRMAMRGACSITIVPACEHGQLSVPGKTFELLALPTHVLALVPPCSDTGQIVSRAGGSTVAPFENDRAVEAAMQRITEMQLAGRLERGRDWRRVDLFDRRVIAAKFADMLNDLRPASVQTGPQAEVA